MMQYSICASRKGGEVLDRISFTKTPLLCVDACSLDALQDIYCQKFFFLSFLMIGYILVIRFSCFTILSDSDNNAYYEELSYANVKCQMCITF